MNISIVVPVYNECENIANLHREINDMCVREGYTYEIIFVDDGSSDSSFQVAQSLTPITYMRLRKNFGQTAAMDAGIKAAKYDYIVTLDGDGQNDPADIPNLLKH
ncbi:MAG: glycosyltransferase [Deferribacteraceae bacterium]|jgi:glycosyltransferase involved in cell wall biosynthesis|nr:glycosyltransferase [Deferribacteraceae bacterium]